MSEKSGFTTKDILMIAVIGGGIYWLYKLFTSLQKSAPVQAASNGIANAYLWATLPDPVTLSYSFILPTGDRINAGSVNLDTTGDGNPMFAYNGKTYLVSSRDDISGDYRTTYAYINEIP